MSSKRSNPNKSCSLKCCHFCFDFDLHNYCPTCREAGKGDDACVTSHRPCLLCSSFLEEQLCKIVNRKTYVRKSKSDLSKDETDLLDDPEMGEILSGSHEELEETAQRFYSSLPKVKDL